MAFGLTENQRIIFVEVVMVGCKAGVDHRELLRLRVVHLDLPRAWAGQREVLGEFVHRSVFAERRLFFRGASPSRHPHAAVAVHGDAARVGLSVAKSSRFPQYGDAGVFGVDLRARSRES